MRRFAALIIVLLSVALFAENQATTITATDKNPERIAKLKTISLPQLEQIVKQAEGTTAYTPLKALYDLRLAKSKVKRSSTLRTTATVNDKTLALILSRLDSLDDRVGNLYETMLAGFSGVNERFDGVDNKIDSLAKVAAQSLTMIEATNVAVNSIKSASNAIDIARAEQERVTRISLGKKYFISPDYLGLFSSDYQIQLWANSLESAGCETIAPNWLKQYCVSGSCNRDSFAIRRVEAALQLLYTVMTDDPTNGNFFEEYFFEENNSINIKKLWDMYYDK
jgi:hypothetical protein